MRNALAAAFVVSFVVALAPPAPAQPPPDREEQAETRLASPPPPAHAAVKRLGAATAADTSWIGHVTSGGQPPYHVGRGPYRPGTDRNGMWDFEWAADQPDSLQGWVPLVRPNHRASITVTDDQRPWMALDYGNRLNAAPTQGHTVGIVSAWHVDAGNLVPDAVTPGASPTWAPLSGGASVWCGLRAGDDLAYLDDAARGGTGNPINGEALVGAAWDRLDLTTKNFPGYANQWDQMLYRDVRVGAGGALDLGFEYQTYLSPGLDNAAKTCTGWFHQDPLSLAAGNFVSASAQGGTGPIDSFMVYVGVPADPESCRYSDGLDRAIFDLRRRWFSEVIAIDHPYREVLSTWGQDSAHKSAALVLSIPNAILQPMLDAQGAPDGGGVIRVVFRVKTNKDYADETGTGGPFGSGTQGAVRLDEVSIVGGAPEVHSGFEDPAEIDNRVEPAESGAPGPEVGEGYALRHWHATGRPPKTYYHAHPLGGGDIGGGNVYEPLAWDDLCGLPDSPLRQCNVFNVVVSSGDHDLSEAAGGPANTPFFQNRQGMMSPTVNLVTPPAGENSCGLDAAHVNTTDDWLLAYDNYAGIFNTPETGNVWQWGVLNYPAVQADGARVWSDICLPDYVMFYPDPLCRHEVEHLKADGLIHTANAGGIPDSIRIYLGREQRCMEWAMPLGCSPTGGHYVDNVALGFPPDLSTPAALGSVSVGIGQWINDTFPFDETAGLPGTAGFDTCAALVKTGTNIAPRTASELRFDVPGDTIVVVADGEGIRVDLVFRIAPGPGNYIMIGNRASGLRRVPTSAAPAAPGDGSFWGEYLASAGEFGTPGGHAGGAWSGDVWNSARCDSAERNFFPVEGRQGNLPGLGVGLWMSAYHEADPKFATLGVLKNRCFLLDTAGVLTNANITCTSVPAWLQDPGLAARAGFDGNPQTREGTKIIPDGLLTPGSHVEYFFRKSLAAAPASFVMVPDTQLICPQPNEGPSYDGHRWQQFGVLPDRWKDAAYGGLGSACMLVVDYDDRRGDERAFISLGDSLGLTATPKLGSHNGWYCQGGYVASDGTHDYTGEIVGGNGQYDATTPMGGHIAIWKHGGQPGTTFDMYQVKAAESAWLASGGIGSRLANRTDMGLLQGKQSMQGPTPEMLRAYYRGIYLFSGDLSTIVLGPVPDCSSNDVAILEDFLSVGADYRYPRGLWVMGDGFAEAENSYGGPHLALLTDYLATSLDDPSYYSLSGSTVPFPDLIATSVIHSGTPPHVFSAQNGCLWTNDVLDVNPAVPGAQVADYYQNLGSSGPYIASVFAPSTAQHPYVTLLDGFDLQHLRTRFGESSLGRGLYTWDVLTNVFSAICPFAPVCGTCRGDAPGNTAPTVDFLDDVWGSPVAGGTATVHFGLAKADRVEIRVYDVTGRRVRSLASRLFGAGEHSLVWDGTNDRGQRVAGGVYFTQVRYVGSGFLSARKLTFLR